MSKEEEDWKETPDLPGETEPDLVETMETVFGRRFVPLMHEGEEVGMVMILGGEDNSSGHNDELDVDEQDLASDLHQIGVDAVFKEQMRQIRRLHFTHIFSTVMCKETKAELDHCIDCNEITSSTCECHPVGYQPH